MRTGGGQAKGQNTSSHSCSARRSDQEVAIRVDQRNGFPLVPRIVRMSTSLDEREALHLRRRQTSGRPRQVRGDGRARPLLRLLPILVPVHKEDDSRTLTRATQTDNKSVNAMIAQTANWLSRERTGSTLPIDWFNPTSSMSSSDAVFRVARTVASGGNTI